MASRAHGDLIAKVLAENPDARTATGFRKRMEALFRAHDPEPKKDPCSDCGEESGCDCRQGWLEMLADHMECFRFLPDAWAERESPDGRDFICWEVNVTTTPQSKIPRYVQAYWAMDDLGPYAVRLINVDALGNAVEVDLFAAGLWVQAA